MGFEPQWNQKYRPDLKYELAQTFELMLIVCRAALNSLNNN